MPGTGIHRYVPDCGLLLSDDQAHCCSTCVLELFQKLGSQVFFDDHICT